MALLKTKPSFGIAKKYSGHSDCITSVTFSRTTKHLISGSNDRTVRVWDVNSGDQVKQVPCMSAVTCMDVNHSDTTFCSGHKSGDIRMFSMSTFDKIHQIPNHHSCQITSINFLHDLNQIVTTSIDGVIKVLEMRTQKTLHEIDVSELSIPAVCSSIGVAKNDQFLAIGAKSGAVFIVDLNEQKVIEVFNDQHSTPVLGVAWDPSHGSRVASIDTLGSLFIWE